MKLKKTTNTGLMAVMAMLVILVTGCQQDVRIAVGEAMQVGQRVPAWMPGQTVTRAATLHAPAVEQPEEIGVFAYQEANASRNLTDSVAMDNRLMVLTPEPGHDGRHHYEAAVGDPVIWRDTRYRLFAYAPYDEDCDVSDNTLTASDLHIVWPTDPTISLVDRLVAPEAITHSPKTDGICAQFTGPDSLVHEYAALQIAFALHPKYSELRYLHLKDVTLTDWVNTTDSCHLVENDWYLAKDDLMGQYKIYGLVYVKPAREIDVASFTLSVTYDVYDRTGQITREDIETTMSIRFGATNITTTQGGQKWFLAGYYYNVLVNIMPKYLYVLSDNDQRGEFVMVVE